MIDLTRFDGYARHDKVWGYEVWLHNSPLYCAKLLVISPGMQCSLHRHRVKTETFFVLQGEVRIELGLATEHKTVGDSVHVPVGTWHRFGNPNTSDFGDQVILLEVSSHHDDADVERFEESGPIA